MTFQELLEQAGLQDQAALFQQDPTKIAASLGFTGNQAQQFGQFFQPFNQEQLLDASKEIASRQETREGFLQNQFSSGFQGIGDSLAQETRQIGQAAGQAGFSGSGVTSKQIIQGRERANQSLADIMQRRNQGMFNIEQQSGQERAGLTSLLQNYLTGVFSQARRIQGLDPNSSSGFTPIPQQNGYGVGTAGMGGGTDPFKQQQLNLNMNMGIQ
tara:strand:- start:3517 stop:4158 length:642 start_codon:yes stop_codon:yes gene_type:complete